MKKTAERPVIEDDSEAGRGHHPSARYGDGLGLQASTAADRIPRDSERFGFPAENTFTAPGESR